MRRGSEAGWKIAVHAAIVILYEDRILIDIGCGSRITPVKARVPGLVSACGLSPESHVSTLEAIRQLPSKQSSASQASEGSCGLVDDRAEN